MRIWTFKTPLELDILQSQGLLHGDLKYISKENPEFLPSYDWMVSHMKKRDKNHSGNYPIWAWAHKIDLRRAEHRFSEDFYLLELEVSRPVLKSHFQLWHFVLNNSYLPKSELDEKEFEIYMSNKYGSKNSSHLDENDRAKVSSSWEFIFDYDVSLDQAKYLDCKATDSIQCCVDGIYLNELVSAKLVKAKRKRV